MSRSREERVNLRLGMSVLCVSLWLAGVAEAQELSAVVASGSYNVLGSTVVSAEKSLPAGFAPVSDDVAYVYDPQFQWFLQGRSSDAAVDRRDEFASYGYVVVSAAGSPGGIYTETPWITHESFDATFVEGEVSIAYGYNTTFVPTMRGFQTYLIYANLERTGGATSLFVYDDALRFGAGNYLLTGDGPQAAAELRFDAGDAAQGSRAISVRSTRNTSGTHWKLMLFANGSAAAEDGVNLAAYDKLVFYAKASRNVVLQGAFGTGDDSGSVGFPALNVTTQYQRFEVDLRKVDRSDVNTPFWVYMHRAQNPFNFRGVTVYFDGIELVGRAGGAAIVVDQTWDSLDGVCATDGSQTGSCNLRAALQAATQVSGPASVALTKPQSVTLGQISVASGADVRLVGLTADATSLYAQGSGRLFQVQAGASLSLADLWVSGFSDADGGAIQNHGNLTLDGVTVSDNTVSCSSAEAMFSSASCRGGAIVNTGTLVLRGGSQFHRNVALASASTASTTSASAWGGAIVNTGELIIDGPVAFANNSADATATSGYHGSVPSDASASAAGGAISQTAGRLTVRGAALGHCSFTNNSAIATASAVGTTGVASSAGGAISAQGTLDIPSGACTFSDNSALTDPDIHVVP